MYMHACHRVQWTYYVRIWVFVDNSGLVPSLSSWHATHVRLDKKAVRKSTNLHHRKWWESESSVKFCSCLFLSPSWHSSPSHIFKYSWVEYWEGTCLYGTYISMMLNEHAFLICRFSCECFCRSGNFEFGEASPRLWTDQISSWLHATNATGHEVSP